MQNKPSLISLTKCKKINSKICKIIENVAIKIVPSPQQEKKVLESSRKVFDAINQYVLPFKQQFGFERLELHGSLAKGTWLPHKIDLDIFIVFRKLVEKRILEELINQIAKNIPFKFEYRYSEHPYLHFPDINGFEVDLVPAFDFDGKKFVSATDRTIYHTKYIKDRINDVLRNEIRLLKSFMRGINCYGAEIKIGGFSGYALELLVLKFGSFLDVINFLSENRSIFVDLTDSWDIEKAKKFFKTRFILIDPVDPNRNVLAALREETFHVAKLASRLFKVCPNETFFELPRSPLTNETIMQGDGTERKIIVAKLVLREYFPEDKIWGILLRVINVLKEQLSREGFRVYLVDPIPLDEKSYLLAIETDNLLKPKYVKILGPPIDGNLKHILRFIGKYKKADAGPWIEKNRLVAIIELPDEKRKIQTHIEKILNMLLKRYNRKIEIEWIKKLETLKKEHQNKVLEKTKKKVKWIIKCGAPTIYNANPD